MFTREYSPPTYPLRVARVADGRLATESGVVFTHDGRLVRETLWDDAHYHRLFDRPPALPAPLRLPGRHASLMSLWCENYFHWLFNSLPRLEVLRRSGVEYDSLIVPRRMAPFHRETLAQLGIAEDRLTPFPGHVQADELIWISPLAPINEPSAYLLEWLRTALRPLPQQPTRKLYVSRQGTRRAINEREVFGALEPMGFEFVVPERLPFAEQVLTFAQTRVAVGPHGSNFVNGIFSDDFHVLEFFQPAHVNWGVYTVLCAAGADHWNCVVPAVRNRRHRRFHDMRIPLELVFESLERMGI
jgi:capsular polysaccharide biosynthesis protein